MGRGIYQRTRPTGFLKPWHIHTVSVDGIGTIYQGRNKRSAERAFVAWSHFSERPIGRASGKRVVHTIDSQITNIHEPK